MARNRYRPGRTWWCSSWGWRSPSGWSRWPGSWTPASRSRPAGRHPDHAGGHRRRASPRAASTRPPASSTTGSTDPASPRPRSPPRATGSSSSRSRARPGVTSSTPSSDRPSCGSGWWPVRRSTPALCWRRRCDSAGPAAAPGPRLRRHRAVGARPQLGEQHARRTGRRSSPQNGEQQTESQQDQPSESPSPSVPAQPSAEGDLVDQPLKWMDNPDPASIKAFNDYECPPAGQAAVVEDDPEKPLVTCDEDGIKYLLSVADDRGHEPDVGQRRHPEPERQPGRWTSSSTGRAPTTSRRSRRPSTTPRSSSRSSWTAR